MRNKRIPGLLIAGIGALLTTIGYIASGKAEGFDGLAYVPLVYGGFFIFLFGIIKDIVQYRQLSTASKVILILILVTIVVGMVISPLITHS